MDLSPVNDFFSNIKDKLTNPFFGTLIIVWLTRNWELVYSIFNFDENLKLEDKVAFIQSYFSVKIFWEELGINIGLAILFMLIGYLLIVGTRTISIIVEHNIMPKITEKFINKDVVLKTVFDEVKKERDEYSDSYENERKKVRESSKDYTQQLSQNKELNDNLINTNKTNNDLRAENSKFRKEIDEFFEANEKLKENLKKLKTENNIQLDKLKNLNKTVNSGSIDIINTELNGFVWQAIQSIFRYQSGFPEKFLKANEYNNVLIFDRKNFDLPNESHIIYNILSNIENSNLGNFKTKSSDISVEFVLNEEGLKLLNIIKLLINYNKVLGYQ